MPNTPAPVISTTSNLFVVRYFELAIKNGIDAQSLLDEINLARGEFADITQRVDIQKLADMMLVIWDRLGDETMGLASEPIPRGTWWMACKLAVHEPNLKAALKAAIRMYGIATRAYRVELKEAAGITTLVFHDYQSHSDPHHLFAEMTLMAWHRLSAWLIGENIPLTTITFPYPITEHSDEYHHMFPARFEFDAPHLSLSFSSSFLQRVVVKDATALRLFMSNCPYELFMQPRVEFSLAHEIKTILEKTLADGSPTLEEAASSLHMSKRTFIRKLKEEGVSYQELKNIVRRDRAIHYLLANTLPIADIASRIGFSDTAVFARAFKGWTGVSPREYRLKSIQN